MNKDSGVAAGQEMWAWQEFDDLKEVENRMELVSSPHLLIWRCLLAKTVRNTDLRMLQGTVYPRYNA